MRRRSFNLMGACAGGALLAGIGLPRRARAAATPAQVASLQTTLTPMGSERAGNADGTIPAWTGGFTTPPAGWDPKTPMPEPFADDKPKFTIDSSNLSQYKDKLSFGVAEMIQNQGLTLQVYETRRTHAMPQWVYDNIAKNAVTAVPEPGGSRLGFTNAYGGYPFPFPDMSDPFEAGAQIMWNHQYKWQGEQEYCIGTSVSMAGGQKTLLSAQKAYYRYPIYKPDGTFAADGKYLFQVFLEGTAPANNVGSQEDVWVATQPLINASTGWTYLSGQGRVRKIPQIQYDVPMAQSNGLTNYDEAFLFGGSMDRYDWKFVEKKEMYIPYNTDKLVNLTFADFLPNVINPDKVRWELHRVYVVSATLHPGDRNVVAHRTLYLDEDTWFGALTDEYDAQGNLWKVGMSCTMNRPDLPGNLQFGTLDYNLQENGYVITIFVDVTAPAGTRAFDFITVPPDRLFNPQTMAERAQY